MGLTCADYHRLWNERLDGLSARSGAADRALMDHEAVCPRCRGIGPGYRALWEGLAAWPAATRTAVPDGFADRALVARATASSAMAAGWGGRNGIGWRPALAAALVALAATVYFVVGREPGAAPPAAPVAAQPSVSPGPPLAEAFSDATTATLELAEAASGPAARLGRDLLAGATIPRTSVRLFPEGPATLALPRSMSDEVDFGVAPLSGPARHAFQFLLGPAANGAPKPDRGA